MGLPRFEIFTIGDADAREAAVVREGDAAVCIKRGAALVIAQDGELCSVNGAEFLDGEAEFEGGERIDFDERPAPLESIAQGDGAGALGADLGPRREARVARRPTDGGLLGPDLAQRPWIKRRYDLVCKLGEYSEQTEIGLKYLGS